MIPQISKALVLCNSSVSFYSLPEFSPAIQRRIRDVHNYFMDVEKEGQVDEDNGVLITALTSKKIRIVRYEDNDVKLIGDIDYASAVTGCQRGSIACVSDGVNYDLVDLDSVSKVPLFPILQGGETSTESAKLPPRIAVVGDEFLVVTGTALLEPAMGMFIDLNGDATRGTLMFSSYPKALAVEHPHVAALLSNRIEIHSIHNQQLVQVIESNNSYVYMGAVNSGWEVLIERLMETLQKVPLEPSQLDISDEITVARRLATVDCRLFVVSQTAVQCLVSTPVSIDVDEKLSQGHYQEAKAMIAEAAESMTVENPHSERLYHELSYLNQKLGLMMLGAGDSENALQSLLQSDLDPRTLLRYFPEFKHRINLETVWVYKGIKALEVHLNLSEDIRALLLDFLDNYRAKKGFGSVDAAGHIFPVVEICILQLLLGHDRGEKQTIRSGRRWNRLFRRSSCNA